MRESQLNTTQTDSYIMKIKSLAKLLFLVTFSLVTSVSIRAEKVKHLTAFEFKSLIFDYTKETKWDNKTQKPILIDFYATWCGPCKRVAPIIEELQDDFKGKITFYKVDVEKERELSGIFGVRSMPTFLFIPAKGRLGKSVGSMNKQAFLKAFKDIFKLEK